MSSRTPNDVLRHRISRNTPSSVTKHTYNTRSSTRLKDIFVNSKEREELMTACSKGDLPKGKPTSHYYFYANCKYLVVELLEDKKTGLNPDLIRDSKLRTPLLVACAAGQADIVRQLIKWGADVNNAMGDIVGNKPLDLAVISNDVDTVLVLLEAGAKVAQFNDTANQIQPDDGLPLQTRLRAARRTPLDLANSRLDLLLKQAEMSETDTKSETMRQVLKVFVLSNRVAGV